MIHKLSGNPYYGNKRNIDIIDKLLTFYCELIENSETDKVRSEIEKIILKPITNINEDHQYYSYMAQAWNEFDKYKGKIAGSGREPDYFIRLKNNVIIPLKLDTNKS